MNNDFVPEEKIEEVKPKREKKVVLEKPKWEFKPGVIGLKVHEDGTPEFKVTRGLYSFRKNPDDPWKPFSIHTDGTYVVVNDKFVKIPACGEISNIPFVNSKGVRGLVEVDIHEKALDDLGVKRAKKA